MRGGGGGGEFKALHSFTHSNDFVFFTHRLWTKCAKAKKRCTPDPSLKRWFLAAWDCRDYYCCPRDWRTRDQSVARHFRHLNFGNHWHRRDCMAVNCASDDWGSDDDGDLCRQIAYRVRRTYCALSDVSRLLLLWHARCWNSSDCCQLRRHRCWRSWRMFVDFDFHSCWPWLPSSFLSFPFLSFANNFFSSFHFLN